MTRWEHMVQRLETRLDRLLPASPVLTHQQDETYALMAAVLGPEVADTLRPELTTHYWLHTALLVGRIQDGAPPSELERDFQRYEHVPWQSPGPQTVAAVQTWLTSPAGQARPVDPWWLLRYERREQQSRSDARFCHDLGIVAVILGGHPEAHARVPDPPASDEIYGPWQRHKAVAAFWQERSFAELRECVVMTVISLACARQPALFLEGAPCTRAQDIALSETLVTEHRAWLHWADQTCPAIVPRPAPFRPMPVERWVEELRQAKAAGLATWYEVDD